MIADNLATPFQTTVLGVEVTVGDIDLTSRNTIVAHCSHGTFEQVIDILDLSLPTPPPDGAEWIEALSPAVARCPGCGSHTVEDTRGRLGG